MNKKLNTFLFIIGATVVNLIIMTFFIILVLFLFSYLLPEDINPMLFQVLFLLSFLLSVGGTFFVYHKLIKFISKKMDMDKYFHPIFNPRKRRY